MLLGDLLPPRFPLSPLLIPHLSPLPLFLICSCNPPHPSPSALLLFLSPSPSYLTISSSCQPLPQIMLHNSSPKSYSYYTKERREGWDVHWDLRIKWYLLQCIPTLKAGARYAIPKEYHWVRTSKLGTSSLSTKPHQVSDGLADLFPPVSDFHLPASP